MDISKQLGKIFRKIIINLSWAKKLWFPLGKKVYCLATSTYKNSGDSAIVLAQRIFLGKCGFKDNHIKEFTQAEFIEYSVLMKRYIGHRHIICLHGGGNFGNLWYGEELFRYRVIDAFFNNPIIIFPQTIYFTDDEAGKKALQDSFSHYENHKQLTIVARERTSYSMLNRLYHNPEKILTPDIVLSTTMSDYGVTVGTRKNVLLVFRSDIEKNMSDDDRLSIFQYLDDNNLPYIQTDMYASFSVTKENRMERVREKMQEFVDAKLVITDRLHGMIFAAITETACIVFSNNHHKIRDTYDWISYLPYIQYVQNVDEAITKIPDFLTLENCKFSREPLEEYFRLLSNKIKSMSL